MMRETTRSVLARFGTFIRFARNQRSRRRAIVATLKPPGDHAILIDGSEATWRPTGLHVTEGTSFRLTAQGHHMLLAPLALAIEPQASLWMRIGDGEIRKIIEPDAVYRAWATGEVSLFSKTLSEWADRQGGVLPGARKRVGPGIGVTVAQTDAPPTPSNSLGDWSHLWRLGEGRIYSVDGAAIDIKSHGDVGILRREVDIPLTEQTVLTWDWLIESLPSPVAEDLPFTHDYISIAVEFDNGRDLTYMWSAELPVDHAFRCPLNWWCERETHLVVRSGAAGLGQWQNEVRTPHADYRAILGAPPPARIVAVWLITNSVFQRIEARAKFRNIDLRAC